MNERTLVRPQVDPAFCLQPVQCLTDRLAAHPELAGQLGLHQVLPRPQPATDDQLDQSLVHGLAQRHRPCHRADERGHTRWLRVRRHVCLSPCRPAFSISAAVSKIRTGAAGWIRRGGSAGVDAARMETVRAAGMGPAKNAGLNSLRLVSGHCPHCVCPHCVCPHCVCPHCACTMAGPGRTGVRPGPAMGRDGHGRSGRGRGHTHPPDRRSSQEIVVGLPERTFLPDAPARTAGIEHPVGLPSPAGRAGTRRWYWWV